MLNFNVFCKRVFLGGIALSMSLSLSGCGEVSTLLSNPNLEKIANALGFELFLTQEVDGEQTDLKAEDIEEISVGGKVLAADAWKVEEGSFVINELPEDAEEITVKPKGTDKPVIIPIDQGARQEGKLVQRGVMRFHRMDGKLHFDEFHGGFDFDRDGQFDPERKQFVHDQQHFMLHDPQGKRVEQFDFKPGHHFGPDRKPLHIVEGDHFFLPEPMRPLVCKHKILEDGTILIPDPQDPVDGEPRALAEGEYELLPGGAIRVIKEDAPDNGQIIGPPPCELIRKKMMMGEHRPCPGWVPKEDGSLDIPLPDGTPRNLVEGEYELLPDGAVKITKPGEPDTGKVVGFPCPRDGMMSEPSAEATDAEDVA